MILSTLPHHILNVRTIHNNIRADYNNVRINNKNNCAAPLTTPGLARTSDQARELLIYVCCGKGKFQDKYKDAIVILHKRLQNGFHRFGEPETVAENWEEFFKLLDKHPSYVKYLDDRGEGDAPQRYLIVVEKCLRRVAMNSSLSKYAMGRFAMSTYESWINTNYWFKREAYIAAVRVRKGLGPYRKYIGYDWQDHMMRIACSKTFLIRHKKYTDGEEKLNIPDPKCWSQPVSRRRRSNKSSNTSKNVDSSTSSEDSGGEQSDQESMVWDSDTGEWGPKE